MYKLQSQNRFPNSRIIETFNSTTSIPLWVDLGCYNDSYDRQLPVMSDTSYKPDLKKSCLADAVQKNKPYAGFQNGEECWLGDKEAIYSGLGPATGSCETFGGPWINRVFKYNGNLDIINLPEENRSYSSVWDNDSIGTGHARSMINSLRSWSAGTNNTDQYAILDLETPTSILGVVIQGRSDEWTNNQYITKYSVEYSQDNNNWIPFNTIFNGNSDGETLVTNNFTNPIKARYFKIIAVEWNNHISARIGLIPYVPPAATQPAPTQPAPTQPVPTQPPPTQPAPTQPAATQPAPTQPPPTQPPPTQPPPTQPPPTQSAPAQPAATQPAPTQPAPTQPAATQPAPTQPAATQPAATQPAATMSTTIQFASMRQRTIQYDSSGPLAPVAPVAPVAAVAPVAPVAAVASVGADAVVSVSKDIINNDVIKKLDIPNKTTTSISSLLNNKVVIAILIFLLFLYIK